MIAKGKAIAHGSNAIHYALREKKLGQVIASNLLGSREPGEIVSELEMVNRHNERCKNKYLRFEIGIAPQDETKLRTGDLFQIVRAFANKMNLGEHQ
jgi:possible mobilization protein bmgA